MSVSLALSIGLISSLNRAEEVIVPSLWPEVMKTADPLAAVCPKMLAMRQALLSPAMPFIPTPMYTLLLPVV